MEDGNTAALRIYEREQDRLEKNFDPTDYAYELQKSLTWVQLMEALQEISWVDGEKLLKAVRLGPNQDKGEVGWVVIDVVEKWSEAKAQEMKA